MKFKRRGVRFAATQLSKKRDKFWIQKMRESPRKMKLWNLKEEALDFPPHNYRKKEKFWKKNWERKLKKNEETQCWTSWRCTRKTEDGNARLQISFSLSFSFSFRYEPSPRTPHVPSILNSWDTRAAVSHACPMSSTCQTWVWHPKCCVYASQLSTKQAKRSGYKSFKGRWPHHWSYQNRTQAPSPTSKVTSALR